MSENFPKGQLWKFYYLYGLERTGRLTGLRYFGDKDWYRVGAEHLVHGRQRDGIDGFWTGADATEQNPVIATSFALLFLAKGRSPVVMNKLRHGPGNDWNNDRDDVRNLVGVVSRDWKHLLTWQVVDPETATVPDLLQAPIAYINGHDRPVFGPEAKKNLREFVEQGGFIFGEACCGSTEFDAGFKALMEELFFPEKDYELRSRWRPSTPSGGRSSSSRPTCIRSGASSTGAARWSSTRRRTSPATGTSRRSSPIIRSW